MDQRIIAGLGNIYVCEALFRAGLSPWKAAARLATRTGKPTPAAERLAAEIKAVLSDAIAPEAPRCATTSAPTAPAASSRTSSASTAARASLA